MRVIDLDATGWRDVLDYYAALRSALGSPDWHGASANAWIDSMVYGDINRVEPPYLIRITGTSKCPSAVREEIDLLAENIREAREEKLRLEGKDAEVEFEINP
jgi:hypothetical protein